jgi:hypothetical protein
MGEGIRRDEIKSVWLGILGQTSLRWREVDMVRGIDSIKAYLHKSDVGF